MDAEVAKMLADLGVERRDIVSAPDADARGREVREDPRAQAAVRREVEARRAQNDNPVNGEEDERAARLRAWNTETTFEQDEVTERLENRWSGQGHRAALNRQVSHRQYDDRWEAVDARFGEERRLYLQQRENNNNYVLANSGQDRFLQHVLSGQAPASRRLIDSARHEHAAPNRAASRARAPSPRRHGTVRFGPGGRRVGAASAETPASEAPRAAVPNPGAAAAAALRAAAASASSVPQPVSATATMPQPVSSEAPPPAPHHTTTVRSSANTTANGVQSTPVPQAAVRTSTQPPPSSSPAPSAASQRTPSAAATTTIVQAVAGNAAWPSPNSIRAQVHFNKALWYAAHPGEECDAYHSKFPDRLQYLAPARDQLIKEVTNLARRGRETDALQYSQTHPERKWMLDAARKAKEQVEDDSDDEIEAYCTVHPRQKAFLRAARAVFAPTRDEVPPSTPAATHSVTNGHIPTTTVAAQQTSTAPVIDSSSSNSDNEDSVETTITPPPRKPGSLTATFFNIAGEFLGIHQVPVRAPVQVTMNLTSRMARYNPRELIRDIEALAQKMVDRTQGLEGVRLSDDGLWESDHEGDNEL